MIYSYLIIKESTSRRAVPLKKLSVADLKKIVHYLWSPKVHYHILKSAPLTLILIYLNSFCTYTVCKIHLNIILICMPTSNTWSLLITSQ